MKFFTLIFTLFFVSSFIPSYGQYAVSQDHFISETSEDYNVAQKDLDQISEHLKSHLKSLEVPQYDFRNALRVHVQVSLNTAGDLIDARVIESSKYPKIGQDIVDALSTLSKIAAPLSADLNQRTYMIPVVIKY
jgi:hypothetical protein